MRGNSYERKRARAERSGGMNHREQDMEGRNDRGGERERREREERERERERDERERERK